MSNFTTLYVLNDLLFDLQDKPDPETPKNYIKALENAIELFKNHSNIIPNNLIQFKDQYLPQFEIQFLNGDQKLHKFWSMHDFECFLLNYENSSEIYALINDNSFYTELQLQNYTHKFSSNTIKKILALFK